MGESSSPQIEINEDNSSSENDKQIISISTEIARNVVADDSFFCYRLNEGSSFHSVLECLKAASNGHSCYIFSSKGIKCSHIDKSKTILSVFEIDSAEMLDVSFGPSEIKEKKIILDIHNMERNIKGIPKNGTIVILKKPREENIYLIADNKGGNPSQCCICPLQADDNFPELHMEDGNTSFKVRSSDLLSICTKITRFKNIVVFFYPQGITIQCFGVVVGDINYDFLGKQAKEEDRDQIVPLNLPISIFKIIKKACALSSGIITIFLMKPLEIGAPNILGFKFHVGTCGFLRIYVKELKS